MDYYGDPGGMPPMYTDPWQVQYGGLGGLTPSWWANQQPPQYPSPYGGWNGIGDLAAFLQGIGNNSGYWTSQPQGSGEAPVQQTPPATPNEGQTVETPEGTPPSPDGTFSTDVTGSANGIPAWALPLGAAGLGGLLAGVLGGGGSGEGLAPMSTPTFSTTVTGQEPAPPSNPPPDFSVTGYGYPDPSWNVTGDGSIGDINWPTSAGTSLVSTPSTGGREFPVSLFPSLVGGLGGLLGGIFSGGGGSPQQPSQPSQGQQPTQSGGAMAQVPFFAAQGGSTSIPAPYAQLPGQTPVGPTFRLQPHARPVRSLGELLLGGGFGG